jgi:4-hydroxybenzoate polyprenyltransferase
VTAAPPRRLSAGELGRFLEIQNLGLNLPFAVAFLFLAARGIPPAWPTLLLIVAFVAARNAGHAFNRWTDRAIDARNPRTQARALVTGRISPRFALGLVALNAAILGVAAAVLNPLALALAPVALLIILGYSATKRLTPLTTVFLGLVESITPAAVYIGLTATLPLPVLLAVGAMLLWGTAFETIHSLGDLDSDRDLGNPTLPGALGTRRSLQLLPVLHASALALLAAFGWVERLSGPYFVALAAMAVLAVIVDALVRGNLRQVRRPFELHFLQGALFFAGVVAALLLPR